MKCMILVVNERRVSEAIGTEVEHGCVLVESEDKNVKQFLKKYDKLIFSTNTDDMQEFF